jgi:hypothetical protein
MGLAFAAHRADCNADIALSIGEENGLKFEKACSSE